MRAPVLTYVPSLHGTVSCLRSDSLELTSCPPLPTGMAHGIAQDGRIALLTVHEYFMCARRARLELLAGVTRKRPDAAVPAVADSRRLRPLSYRSDETPCEAT